jgi:hypothetical protein
VLYYNDLKKKQKTVKRWVELCKEKKQKGVYIFTGSLLYKIASLSTESIYIFKPLSVNYVGKELGKIKLEHTFKQILFLAPKVYDGISDYYELVKIYGV